MPSVRPRVVRERLLGEVEVLVNGKKCKMLRLEAVVAKQVSSALNGNTQAAKLLLLLAEKYIPTHRSLAELMERRPVFEWTPEEEARFDKVVLLEGAEQPKDKKPVL